MGASQLCLRSHFACLRHAAIELPPTLPAFPDVRLRSTAIIRFSHVMDVPLSAEPRLQSASGVPASSHRWITGDVRLWHRGSIGLWWRVGSTSCYTFSTPLEDGQLPRRRPREVPRSSSRTASGFITSWPAQAGPNQLHQSLRFLGLGEIQGRLGRDAYTSQTTSFHPVHQLASSRHECYDNHET